MFLLEFRVLGSHNTFIPQGMLQLHLAHIHFA
jgi:hypothetical protein